MKYEETWGGFKIGDSTEASPVPQLALLCAGCAS
jgi:hypothetical protein